MATATRKKTKSGRKPSSRTKAAPPPPQKRPVRREVLGGVLLALALFTVISYFGVSALFVDLWASLLKGLFGYGYWLAALSLLAAGLIQLLHRGRPVRLRTACALLATPLLGAILHTFLCRTVYEPSFFPMLKEIFLDGRALRSGGAVSGVAANALAAVFSKFASSIMLLAALALCLFAAGRTALASLSSWRRSRPRYEYEEDEEEEAPPPRPAPAAKPRRRTERRPQIDFPLDDVPGEEPAREAPAAEEEPSGRFTGFFRHKPDHQRTPDQVLAEPEPIPAPEDVPVPAAEPAPIVAAEMGPGEETGSPPEAEDVAETEPMLAEMLSDRRRDKASTAKEVAAQTAAVAAEIRQKLSGQEGDYQTPPLSLLRQGGGSDPVEAGAELRSNARRLSETLNSFGVDATPGDVVHGPSVTRYEFTLDQGVKLSKITNLADDIALALGAAGVRIAPIPDKISVVGIEVPNRQVTPVLIRDVIESRTFREHPSRTAFALGRDIGGRDIVGDVGTLPHVLIAGTTGSGKSVCTNSLIVSILYKAAPEEVRFIMVDPKMVELAPYNGIPHLLIPVVTDPKKAAGALQWAVYEMMKRYKTFSEHGVKKLEEFNRLARTDEELETLPSVVVVIDELADLMLVAAKEVEESICRVAQMGRAAGVHLVIATQRPSADVITGLMKANIPSRIAFAVASSLESRIILDNTGAEKLVGKGDMLYAPLGAGKPVRVQGCFISPEEIERVVAFVKSSGEARYDDEVIAKIEESVQEKGKGSRSDSAPEPEGDSFDELLPAAVDVVLETGQASVSMLQRRLKLGYSRAARLVDQMEQKGIVGPFEGSKPRQLLITKEQWQERKMAGEDPAAPPEEG